MTQLSINYRIAARKHKFIEVNRQRRSVDNRTHRRIENIDAISLAPASVTAWDHCHVSFYLYHSYSIQHGTNYRISPCVRVSVCVHLRSHFLLDFHQNWHRRKTPKAKTSSLGVNIAPPFSSILPQSPPFLAKRSSNTLNINNNPITALSVRESPKFSLGRETRWWRQTIDRKWKYGRFAHTQYNPYYIS